MAARVAKTMIAYFAFKALFPFDAYSTFKAFVDVFLSLNERVVGSQFTHLSARIPMFLAKGRLIIEYSGFRE